MEPIITNVMQNSEYFAENNQKIVPAPILITQSNYYNENMSVLLKKIEQTDI